MNKPKNFNISVSGILYHHNRILLLTPNNRDDWQTISGFVTKESIEDSISFFLSRFLNITDAQLMDVIDAHTAKNTAKDILNICFLIKSHTPNITPQNEYINFRYNWFLFSETKKLNIVNPYHFQVIEKAFFLLSQYLVIEPEITFFKYQW